MESFHKGFAEWKSDILSGGGRRYSLLALKKIVLAGIKSLGTLCFLRVFWALAIVAIQLYKIVRESLWSNS